MKGPAHQVIADLIVSDVLGFGWTRLDDLCLEAVRRLASGCSDAFAAELVEERRVHVRAYMDALLAGWEEDGVPPRFEIDYEQPPNLRRISGDLEGILAKLRILDPLRFEQLCADILAKLGGKASVTPASHDGGVDFLASGFDIVPDGIPTPYACRAAVIGQAKRYKAGNRISETQVREFVGGATLIRADIQKRGLVGVLSPVILAFWTTSGFDAGARSYCQRAGIWYLEGLALAKYVRELDLLSRLDCLLAPQLG